MNFWIIKYPYEKSLFVKGLQRFRNAVECTSIGGDVD